MPQPSPRAVVREHRFEDPLRALIPDPRGADEYVLPMAAIEGAQMALYYTFDETTVHFLALA